MKLILGFLFTICLLSFQPADDLYQITVTTIDGQKIKLADFKGKKILFVVLPAAVQDIPSFQRDLETIETNHYSSLVIIGIPAEEAGYKIADKSSIKKTYKDQKPNFIILEGMKARKNQKSGQSALFQWLTNKDKNGHFDQDMDKAGQKFFVDEKGELYAVVGAEITLTNPVIEKILTKATK